MSSTVKIVKVWGSNPDGIPEFYPKSIINNHPMEFPIPVGYTIADDVVIQSVVASYSAMVSNIISTKNKRLILPFVLSNSNNTQSLSLINFKDTNLCEAKKFPTIKGELRTIEYYMDSEKLPDFTIRYINKAVVETNSWEYLTDNSTTPPKKLPLRRTTRLEYLLEDSSIGHTVETYKNYDQTFLADILEALRKRHQNIIAEVGLFLIQIFSFSKVSEFNKLFALEINAYISGSGQVLVDAVNNSSDPDLTSTIKASIIDILSY